MKTCRFLTTTVLLILFPVFCLGQAYKRYEKLNNKVVVVFDKGKLFINPLNESTFRIQYAIDITNDVPELVFTSKPNVPDFKVIESDYSLEISTSQMAVILDKEKGILSYRNKSGIIFLKERPDSRIFKQSSIQGEPCYIAGQSFESPEDEFLFGTGQFQDGYLNIRGLPRKLIQVNSQISIPFIISNKGYGLLWHNYGLTYFNPADEKVNLEPVEIKGEKVAVDVTTTKGTMREIRQDAIFHGVLKINERGKYAIFLDVGQKMARKWQVSIDGKDIINFKNYWLPPTTSTIVELETGNHKIEVTCERNDIPVLYYRKLTNETVFRSPVADILDYVVFSGSADEVISSYRNLTGKAPLLPIWALGYIHCRERFNTQDELLENATEFRKRRMPVDIIVQDWQYWGKHGWNAMKFDEEKYPDPAKMVDSLHNMNMRLMVSVWSKFDFNSDPGKEFAEKGYFIPNTQWVDFFNPEAADSYWKNLKERLFSPYRIDSWWLDATEPENDDLESRKINNGTTPGERMRNIYPLFVTKTVFEGSKKDIPESRVFILTRCAFLGQQRYSTAVWSGDVGYDWETLRRQITAGLNLSVTGIPWWTFDAGGFFRPGKGQYNDTKYHEIFLRWFQFATFCPLQRIHGYQTNTEFWRYGEKVEKEALKYLNLRYRLLPYIYSHAAGVTFNNGTIMRPLVMDFADDKNALQQNYEYMFGTAFLVAPVITEGTEQHNVYLPQNQSGWFDFWTGKHYDAGITIKTEAPLSIIPLFVRAGSIIPMGKYLQHTNEKTADTLEIRIYTGSNCKFDLYEDEGTNYNYEKGAYTIIPFEWNEQNKTLVIGKRRGNFDGLLKKRSFNIVFVNDTNGKGIEPGKTDIHVKYSGKKVTVALKK